MYLARYLVYLSHAWKTEALIAVQRCPIARFVLTDKKFEVQCGRHFIVAEVLPRYVPRLEFNYEERRSSHRVLSLC